MDQQLDDPAGTNPTERSGWPIGRAGRVAAWATVVGVGVFVLASATAGAFGRRDPGTLDDVMRLLGPVFGITLVGSALVALVSSILALRSGERPAIVWLSLGFGVLGMVFLLGELLLPH